MQNSLTRLRRTHFVGPGLVLKLQYGTVTLTVREYGTVTVREYRTVTIRNSYSYSVSIFRQDTKILKLVRSMRTFRALRSISFIQGVQVRVQSTTVPRLPLFKVPLFPGCRCSKYHCSEAAVVQSTAVRVLALLGQWYLEQQHVIQSGNVKVNFKPDMVPSLK